MDPDALETCADKVESSVGEIQKYIDNFRLIIEDLNTTWSSDVKDKFFTNYEQDMKALYEMVSQYAEVSTGLRQMAEYQRRTEEELRLKIEKARKARG